MLKAKDKLSADDFASMLMDTHSEMAKTVAPYIAKLKPDDPKAQEAVKLLNGWDANLTADSAAAMVYELTVQNAYSQTYSDDLGRISSFSILTRTGLRWSGFRAIAR